MLWHTDGVRDLFECVQTVVENLLNTFQLKMLHHIRNYLKKEEKKFDFSCPNTTIIQTTCPIYEYNPFVLWLLLLLCLCNQKIPQHSLDGHIPPHTATYSPLTAMTWYCITFWRCHRIVCTYLYHAISYRQNIIRHRVECRMKNENKVVALHERVVQQKKKEKNGKKKNEK